MGSQQLCLKWNNHHSNMQNMFEELLNSETFVDVTLACDGCTLKAHKLVLSACSPFFQSIFIENPCKHPVIILKDMRISELKAIVNFMYRGEVNISQDQLAALLKTAETLKIKGLAEITGDSRAHQIQQAISTDSTFSSSGSYEAHQTPSPPSLSRRKRTRPQKQLLNDATQSDSEENLPTKSPNVLNNIETEPVSLFATTQKENSSCLPNQKTNCTSTTVTTTLDNGGTSEPARSVEVETLAEPQPPLAQTPSFESNEQPASPALTDDLDNGINSSSPSSLVPFSEASSLPVILEIKPELQYEDGGNSSVNSPEVSPLVYPDVTLPGPSSFPEESIEPPSVSIDGVVGGSTRFGPLQSSYNLHATLDMVLKRKEYAGGFLSSSGGGSSGSGNLPGDKGDKPNCPICNKTYSSKSNLQRHMEMHFGQRKKYACHVCKKFFTWKTNLTTHIKTIHKSIASS